MTPWQMGSERMSTEGGKKGGKKAKSVNPRATWQLTGSVVERIFYWLGLLLNG